MYPSFDEGSLYYTDVRVLIYKSGGSFLLEPKVWFICPHRFGEGINHSLRNESIRTAGKTLARQTEHGASLSDSAAEKTSDPIALQCVFSRRPLFTKTSLLFIRLLRAYLGRIRWARMWNDQGIAMGWEGTRERWANGPISSWISNGRANESVRSIAADEVNSRNCCVLWN